MGQLLFIGIPTVHLDGPLMSVIFTLLIDEKLFFYFSLLTERASTRSNDAFTRRLYALLVLHASCQIEGKTTN